MFFFHPTSRALLTPLITDSTGPTLWIPCTFLLGPISSKVSKLRIITQTWAVPPWTPPPRDANMRIPRHHDADFLFIFLAGKCLTPTQLLICSSFSRENGHVLLVCSSLSTSQLGLGNPTNKPSFATRRLHPRREIFTTQMPTDFPQFWVVSLRVTFYPMKIESVRIHQLNKHKQRTWHVTLNHGNQTNVGDIFHGAFRATNHHPKMIPLKKRRR